MDTKLQFLNINEEVFEQSNTQTTEVDTVAICLSKASRTGGRNSVLRCAKRKQADLRNLHML